MSLPRTCPKGTAKQTTEKGQVETMLSQFLQSSDDWPCAKVAKFAHAVCGFTKDQADRLEREKIDLVTLADMSREEIVHVTNCAWGDARRLKKALETFVDKAAMFEQKAPTCDSKKILLPCKIPVTREKSGQKSLSDLQSEGQQDRVPKPLSCDQKRTSRGENSIASTKDQKSKKRSNTKSMLLEHLQIPADSHARISSDRKQLSGRSSVGSMTVPVSCAQDPVLRQDHTGRSLVERLSERVWGVKPKEEEPAQWGGDYVSEFHPAAKENYINVFRSLRKEFENLREEVVVAAWTENFPLGEEVVVLGVSQEELDVESVSRELVYSEFSKDSEEDSSTCGLPESTANRGLNGKVPSLCPRLIPRSSFQRSKGPGMVDGCEGLPLTLEVLGKYLRGKSFELWAEIPAALRKCDEVADLEEKVWIKLRLSYDGLPSGEVQNMFLDVASFFICVNVFTASDAIMTWSAIYDGSAYSRLQILEDRALVTVRQGKDGKEFYMHEHLRRMGQRIARLEGRSLDLSRIWSLSTSYLNENQGEGAQEYPYDDHVIFQNQNDWFRFRMWRTDGSVIKEK
ncbi:hypothetical protein R1sor_021375 [Riccia sorocarpa]|uniref:Uncharacterized protein n=1 Tax=Riccia sorocarpa TaxID=122646 RepID=A0ABD3GJ19_9MARC